MFSGVPETDYDIIRWYIIVYWGRKVKQNIYTSKLLKNFLLSSDACFFLLSRINVEFINESANKNKYLNIF
jgi:hypothetical protein